MALADDTERRRRSELNHLLTTCRSRLGTPLAAGRNGGIRQEDVADLAHVSVRRYAAFERGEIASPSLGLMASVASALRMTLAQRSALHVLATGQDPPMTHAPGLDGEFPAFSLVLRQLVARLDPDAAAITDEMWTIAIRNHAMTAWSGGWFDRVSPQEQNIVLYMFSEQYSDLVADVHAHRRATIAALRYQYTRNLASPRFAALIQRLLATGTEARELWERHEIEIPKRLYRTRVRHPSQGIVETNDVLTPISDRLWLHVIMFPTGIAPPVS